jgi:hypothetical protein
MVEAQGHPDLVAKRVDRWLLTHGQSPWSSNFWGQAPMKQTSWVRALMVKPHKLNNPGVEKALVVLPENAPEGLSPQEWTSPLHGKTL